MKFTKRILAVMATVLILAVSSFTAVVSADESTLTFNGGKTANVGDTITYTFSLGDCPEPLVGIQMYLYYNPEYLKASEKYKTDLSGYAINTAHIDDKGNAQVRIACSNISGMDFSSKGTIISLDFEVLKGGESDITYFVTEMYTLDNSGDVPEIVPLSAYTFHQDITVNGNSVAENETPKLETDDDKFTDDQISNFVNNEEGKSDGQTTYVPEVESTTEAGQGETVEPVTDENGEVVTTPVSDGENQQATTDGQNADGENQQEGNNIVLIIVIIAGVVVVVGIILLLVTKKKN